MHKKLLLGLLFTFFFTTLSAQALLTATDSTGGAYTTISAAGYAIEGPDDSSAACQGNGPGNHSVFGDHVTQTKDDALDRNVFVFHSHIDEDNDRCVVFDRARMELKGGPAGNTDVELEHDFGDTSYYRWQFRLADDFIGASSFTHLFQNKAAGGTDSGFPILTLTARVSRLDLLHNAGNDNPSGSQGQLATASLDRFRGKWVEVYMRQVHTNAGQLTVSITDMETGLPILLYEGSDLDLWRGPDQATNIINRPKWGIYRSYNTDAGLQDEQVRFAQFCASESAEDACPSLIEISSGGPEVVTNVLPLDGSVNVPLFMPLVWDAVAGATEYRVYLGASATELELDTTLTGNRYQAELAAGTTYFYQIGSVNGEGEARSPTSSFTTLVNPDDGSWKVARGHAAPHVEAADFFELNTNLAMVGVDSTARVLPDDGNNTYCWFSGPKEDGNGNYRWRYRQLSTEETTLVVRLRAFPDRNNIAFIEFYGLGWRQKLRINRTSLKFEKTPDDPEITFPDGFWDDGAYHVIRATFANDPEGGSMLTTVYLDEEETAFAGPLASDEEKTSSFIDFGRAGSTNYGSCIDYLAINPGGAFAPGQDPAGQLPADLAGDAPLVVTNTLPLGGSENVPLSMPLIWNAAEGSSSYNVYLGTEANDLMLDTNLNATIYYPELAAGITYFYQIGSMNEQGEARSPVASFTTLQNPDDGAWKVARGHARPELETPDIFEFDTNLGAGTIDSVATIDSLAGNNAYCWFSGPKEGSNGNYRWRYRQEEGEEVTVIVRLKALPDNNNVTYIEFYGLGWRQKLRINQRTLKVEKTVDDPELAFPDGFWDDGAYHTVRVTFANDPAGGSMLTTIYLDENAWPLGGTSFASDEEKDGSYLDVGRAGGVNYGACFDYIAVNSTGIFAPGAGAASSPPADLILPDPIVSTQVPAMIPPRVFPNPTGGVLHLTGLPQDEPVNYRLYNLNGQCLLRGQFRAERGRISTEQLAPGMYFLHLRQTDGGRITVRFVRE